MFQERPLLLDFPLVLLLDGHIPTVQDNQFHLGVRPDHGHGLVFNESNFGVLRFRRFDLVTHNFLILASPSQERRAR
jgi:hypothetical protein